MSCMAFIVQDENKRIEQWCSELVAFNSGPAIDCILYRYYSSAAISLSLHILLLKQTCPSSWTFPINFPNSPLLQTSSRKCWHASRQTFSHSLPEAWLWETRYLELPFWIRPSKLSSPRPMPKSNLHCFMGKYIWFPNGPNWHHRASVGLRPRNASFYPLMNPVACALVPLSGLAFNECITCSPTNSRPSRAFHMISISCMNCGVLPRIGSKTSFARRHVWWNW